jgi:hypothetical protein
MAGGAQDEAHAAIANATGSAVGPRAASESKARHTQGVMDGFTEFGPNTTTFIYPAELFPVEVRTTGHGISAGAGKMGAFAGAFLFPDLLASSWGIRGAEIVSGIVALAGLLLTFALLPEPKGKSLEELEAEARAPRALRLETA